MTRRIRFPWKGSTEGYAVRYLQRNLWRLDPMLYTMQDAVAEAYLIHRRCVDKYARREGMNRRWMMSLFQRALMNEVNKWSNKRTARSSETTVEVPEDLVTGVDYNGGPLLCLIAEASDEVRDVLHLLTSAPAELVNDLEAAWRKRGHRNAGSSKHVSELLGYSSTNADLLEELRLHFESDMMDD